MGVKGPAKGDSTVYVVWQPFTETLGASIRLSVWANRGTAERVAREGGGLVIPRRIHPYYEDSKCDKRPPLVEPE